MNPFDDMTPVPIKSGSIEAYSNRAVAEIQAQVILAKRFPRDQKESVDRILRDCSRATLAEKAMYTYKRGTSLITGPSIRLAECIQRGWGNMNAGVKTGEKTDHDSLMIAYAWDIETNAYYSTEFRVAHTRDRKSGRKDLVDERDIYEMESNQAARRVRTCILKLVPGDVVDAAVERCGHTLAASVGDIAKARTAMLDTFKAMGVTKDMIEKRLGHRIESVEPGEIVTMRNIFNSLRDKMATVEDYFETPKAPEELVKAATVTQPQTQEADTETVSPKDDALLAEELTFKLEEILASARVPESCQNEIKKAFEDNATAEVLKAIFEKAMSAIGMAEEK
jgi:hypothetical protein